MEGMRMDSSTVHVKKSRVPSLWLVQQSIPLLYASCQGTDLHLLPWTRYSAGKSKN